MRDALSLLDQAIAYGGGEVREPVVRSMLGAVDTEYLYRIVDALLDGDGAALLAEADAMAARSIGRRRRRSKSWPRSSIASRVAQAVPAAAEAMDDAERIAAYASRMAPEMRAARLSDLRPGSRRSGARTRRGDRLFDDAAAPAGVRAGADRSAMARATANAGGARLRAPASRQAPTSAASPRADVPPYRPPPCRRRTGRRRRRRALRPDDAADWPAFVAGLEARPASPRSSLRRPSSSAVDGNVADARRCPRRTSISPTRPTRTS